MTLQELIESGFAKARFRKEDHEILNDGHHMRTVSHGSFYECNQCEHVINLKTGEIETQGV